MPYKPKYFGDGELHGQRHLCSDDILESIDLFRKHWGKCIVSPVPGAVARLGASRSKSQHSVDYWGVCNAVDLFPVGLRPDSANDWQKIRSIAKKAGISGLGLYPEARLGEMRGMVHLDRRDIWPSILATAENPATWSAFRRFARKGWRYAAIDEVENKIFDGGSRAWV